MAELIQQIFNIELCPELANLIVSNLNDLDYTILGHVSKNIRALICVNYRRHRLRLSRKAAKRGYCNILEWLKDCKYIIDYKYVSWYACEFGHINVLNWLKKENRYVKLADKKHMWLHVGALIMEHVVTQSVHYNKLEVLKWAVANGCDINKPEYISDAWGHGYSEIVEYLQQL
jgi:hypothetical protein